MASATSGHDQREDWDHLCVARHLTSHAPQATPHRASAFQLCSVAALTKDYKWAA